MALRVSGILVLLLAVALGAPAIAQEDMFYRGRTITISVGFAPGGGNDAYARLVARHMGRHLPGHPTIIVENTPGAGSARAISVVEAGAKDGTQIATFSADLINGALLDPEHVKIDFAKYVWLGSTALDDRMCNAWHATGIKNLDDLRKAKEFVVGTAAQGSVSYTLGSILKHMFGAPVRFVMGYQSSAQQNLAMERGELDGVCATWSTSVPPAWARERKINVLAWFVPKKAPGYEDAPYLGDIAASEHDRQVIKFLVSVAEVGRPYLISNQVPPGRVAMLRKAFDDAMTDPETLADAGKMNLPLQPYSGEETAKLVAQIYNAPPDIIAAGRQIAQ